MPGTGSELRRGEPATLCARAHRQAKAAAALPLQVEVARERTANPGYLNLQGRGPRQPRRLPPIRFEVYEAVLGKDYPLQPKVWMSYGQSALRDRRAAGGRRSAYRRAIAVDPSSRRGLLESRQPEDLSLLPTRTRSRCAGRSRQPRGLERRDRLHFEFSLGKACEDGAAYESSFDHYTERQCDPPQFHPYSAPEEQTRIRAAFSSRAVTADFFASRAGGKDRCVGGPIFIVGLPRAGSTLIEQILSRVTRWSKVPWSFRTFLDSSANWR